MIYLFTGNNDYQIQSEIGKWKEKFISKYGDFNLFHIKNLSAVSKNYLAEVLLSQSFFSDKKLIIIEGYPLSTTDKEVGEEIDTFFQENIKSFPEDNIIVFVSQSPDKRTKSYKDFIQSVEVRDYSFQDDNEAINLLYNEFKKIIGVGAIKLLFEYKGGNISKTVREIEKLSLFTTSQITEQEVKKYILPEVEQSIFMIIDTLFSRNISLFLKQLEEVQGQMNIYAFYNAFLGNFRNYFYIHGLKHIGLHTSQIGAKLGLGNKAFLVNKQIKLHYKELSTIYTDLIKLDKKMKTGKMIGTEEEDFLYEIKKVFIKNLG